MDKQGKDTKTRGSEEKNLVAIKQKNALSWALGARCRCLSRPREKWGVPFDPKTLRNATKQHKNHVHNSFVKAMGMPHRWLWLTVKSNW